MILLSIGTSKLDNLLQLLGVSVLFIFILMITIFTTKLVGGIKAGQLKNSNFKVIETYKISQNKFLQIIQVGSKYFVISISKDDIRFITELDKDELTLEQFQNKQRNYFSEILNKVAKKQKEKNNNNDQNDQ